MVLIPSHLFRKIQESFHTTCSIVSCKLFLHHLQTFTHFSQTLDSSSAQQVKVIWSVNTCTTFIYFRFNLPSNWCGAVERAVWGWLVDTEWHFNFIATITFSMNCRNIIVARLKNQVNHHFGLQWEVRSASFIFGALSTW